MKPTIKNQKVLVRVQILERIVLRIKVQIDNISEIVRSEDIF
jgi:hypothetical protein